MSLSYTVGNILSYPIRLALQTFFSLYNINFRCGYCSTFVQIFKVPGNNRQRDNLSCVHKFISEAVFGSGLMEGLEKR